MKSTFCFLTNIIENILLLIPVSKLYRTRINVRGPVQHEVLIWVVFTALLFFGLISSKRPYTHKLYRSKKTLIFTEWVSEIEWRHKHPALF